MSVGQDLLDTPFPQMVQNLAFAIAQGQTALDRSSLETTRALAREKVQIIEEIHETITPAFEAVNLTVNDDQGNPHQATVVITGARITSESTAPVDYTLLQAGLFPTFYQFTESIIEVKMSISSKTSSSNELDAGASLSVSGGFGPVSATFAAHVNYKSSNTYSYSAEGSSLLRTTLKPVPPPSRFNWPRVRLAGVSPFPAEMERRSSLPAIHTAARSLDLTSDQASSSPSLPASPPILSPSPKTGSLSRMCRTPRVPFGKLIVMEPTPFN